MEPLQYDHHSNLDPETWDRLCAFTLYFAHGYETAVDIYPEQAQFLLANLDKTMDEIRQQCYGTGRSAQEQ